MKHLGPMVFGLTGVGFGVTGVAFALLVHNHKLLGNPWLALVFCVVGGIGSVLLRSRSVIGAVLMMIAGIGGIASLHQLFALAGTLLIIPGALVLFFGREKVQPTATTV